MSDVRDRLPGFAHARRRLAANAAHRLALYLSPLGEIGERRGDRLSGGPKSSHVEYDRASVISDVILGKATARLPARHLVYVYSQLPRQPAHGRRGGDEFASFRLESILLLRPNFGLLRSNFGLGPGAFATRGLFFLGLLFAQSLEWGRFLLSLFRARSGSSFRPRS